MFLTTINYNDDIPNTVNIPCSFIFSLFFIFFFKKRKKWSSRNSFIFHCSTVRKIKLGFLGDSSLGKMRAKHTWCLSWVPNIQVKQQHLLLNPCTPVLRGQTGESLVLFTNPCQWPVLSQWETQCQK